MCSRIIEAILTAIYTNKLMVIDKETVITGSFNFTIAAEKRNAENLLVIKSKELAEFYRNSYFQHREHSGQETQQDF